MMDFTLKLYFKKLFRIYFDDGMIYEKMYIQYCWQIFEACQKYGISSNANK